MHARPPETSPVEPTTPRYSDRTILITGGTGSFGKTVVEHLLGRGCRQIRVFSRDEAKQDAMRTAFADRHELAFYIGDVRDRPSVEHAMGGVDYVFHAAALKQVPSCEFFPMQAVLTNVIGSVNVVEAAIATGVSSVVCLSTDKAVMPVNAMGMTKGLMEKAAQAATRYVRDDRTVISCVRYGNVMCSRGSVIPRFIEQIRAGKPVTITDPAMTRFMLPLRDSVALVEHAFTHARPGDVFIKKAPACTIADLAQALTELFRSSVPVQLIGTRHGEKVYETLATAEELRRAEDMGAYYRIAMDDRGLDYEKYFTEGDPGIAAGEDYHSHNTERLDVEATKALLLSLPDVRAALREAGVDA